MTPCLFSTGFLRKCKGFGLQPVQGAFKFYSLLIYLENIIYPIELKLQSLLKMVTLQTEHEEPLQSVLCK